MSLPYEGAAVPSISIAEHIALKTALAERDAELAATKADLAAVVAERDRYKAAWEACDRRLSWMQGHPALPPRYLGRHIADAASDMIAAAYPEFRDAIARRAVTHETDSDDGPCTDCGDTGWRYQSEQRCTCGAPASEAYDG